MYQQRAKTLLWATAAVLALQLGLAWLVLTAPSAPGASLVGLGTDAQPVEVCPGEYLDYTATISVERDASVMVVRSWFRTEPNPATVIWDVAPLYAVLRGPSSYTNKRHTAVPDLEPGQYEYRLAIQTIGRNTEPSMYVVPFTIREGCE
jgi:hypothetical protein